MTKAVLLHEYIYNLLIVKKRNHFTVTHLRDEIIEEHGTLFCNEKARKLAYRHLSQLVKKGLMYKRRLQYSDDTVYSTTALFDDTVFRIKKAPNPIGEGNSIKVQQNSNVSFLLVLEKEKITHQNDLRFVTEEMKVFENLITRFPEQKECVEPFYYEAKKRSTELYSHVSALSKILNGTVSSPRAC